MLFRSFAGADGLPLALAGLYNAWFDRATGEVVESYTMLTVNADDHPLMRRMHKPDPAYGPDEQDKRSVVVISPQEQERWLRTTPEDARALVCPPPEAWLVATPLDKAS